MDYEEFKKEFKKYDDHDWTEVDRNYSLPNLKDGKHWLRIVEGYDKPKETSDDEVTERKRTIREDIDRFVHKHYVGPVDNDGNFYHPESQNDMVNSPAHYTRGSQECIDIIEEAIQDAPDVKAGMLQAQVLKYLLRLWLKSNAPQDAQKAQWYLTRLINHLGETK